MVALTKNIYLFNIRPLSSRIFIVTMGVSRFQARHYPGGKTVINNLVPGVSLLSLLNEKGGGEEKPWERGCVLSVGPVT